MTDEELLRYSRHILLDEIGIEGQSRLANSKVLIVGAGGLGCPVALYMASAGVGTIVIADDDEVDLTNLQRQVLHVTDRVG
ncbi:MAG: ThiF family adenylyltransferase, partial [Limnobacter sp.]|nr:ThiF family adenylyltransferase [Limnobacter sp.]